MVVKIGDIFNSKCSAIVNTVNCVGVMGKGIAKEFKTAYPDMYRDYVRKCDAGEVKIGRPYVYKNEDGLKIINFPTKEHWRSPSKLSYVTEGLDWFIQHYVEYGIDSIAFPPLGCGNGGLSWDVVGPVMYQKLNPLPIHIEIYAPYGTAREGLTNEFLMRPIGDREVQGRLSNRINPKWYLILQAVRELNERMYVLNVGRTAYQKLCYVMTRGGVDTGFSFTKGTYGPYSADVKKSISILANANLITEEPGRQMIVMRVADNLTIRQEDFSPTEWSVKEHAVDLFSRLKSAGQAEMIATVMYAYDELKKKKSDVSDKDVYDYVMDWKPRWRTEKEFEVCDAIMNLAMLSWISIEYSNQLMDTQPI